MKTTIKNGHLIIDIELSAARPSTTGKSMIVATTSGFKPTEAAVDGKNISVSVNAIVRA